MDSRILVVEDGDLQQFMLKSSLEKTGYDLALVNYRLPAPEHLPLARPRPPDPPAPKKRLR